MNRMEKLVLVTFFSTMLCTSCKSLTLQQRTGEWGIDDFIYIKCIGNEAYEYDPTGWVYLNDEKYTFTISHFKRFLYYIGYDEDSPKYKLRDTTIWEAHIEVSRDNRMEILVTRDWAGGKYEDKTIYLDPIKSSD